MQGFFLPPPRYSVWHAQSVQIMNILNCHGIIYCIYSLYLYILYRPLLWQLYAAQAGLAFQLPVCVLFWRLEKWHPEGLLELDGMVCLLPVFSFLHLNSSTCPCLIPTPTLSLLLAPHVTLTFFLTPLSLTFYVSPVLSPAHSLFHTFLLSHMNLASLFPVVINYFFHLGLILQ